MTQENALSLFFAHAGHAGGHCIANGFIHPVSGLDHLLAMIAVGVWAAMLGGRAVWLVPASFVALMALGGAIGMAGVGMPIMERGIGGSVFLLGILITVAARLPLSLAAGIVGVFALFHGVAHGAGMPFSNSGIAYGFGFLAATAALHLAGIGVGIVLERIAQPVLLRATGAAIAVVGGLSLAGLI